MFDEYHKLFKEVKTESENEMFNELWRDICIEKGVTFLDYHPNSQRFFILDYENVVGTVEFTKRDPSVFSSCEIFFPFEKHPKVSKKHDSVYEVGKISIKKESRSKNHLDKIVTLFFLHAKYNHVEQYLGYIELKMYKALLLLYGIRFEKIGDIQQTELHSAAPIVCDVPRTLKKLENSSKFKLLKTLKN